MTKKETLTEHNHIPCLIENCNGNIIFEGIKDRRGYFKCCICKSEFEHYKGIYKRVRYK